MFEIFRQESVITTLMFAFLILSLSMRVFLGVLYANMIRETDNMAATKNKLLRQCKLKFSNCYKLNNGVANIPVFVDKFINRLSLGHLSFEMLYHMSGQTMLFSVVCAGVGICRSILLGRTLGQILPFYIVSFAGLYLYFSVSTVVDIKGKKRILRTNLVDYLENHLSARIDVTENDMDRLFGPQNARGGTRRRSSSGGARRTVELMPINGSAAMAPIQKETAPAWAPVSPEMEDTKVSEEELEALLKEFLWS